MVKHLDKAYEITQIWFFEFVRFKNVYLEINISEELS